MAKNKKDNSVSNLFLLLFLGLLGPFIFLRKNTPKNEKIAFFTTWLVGFSIFIYFVFLYPTSYLLAPKYYYLKMDFSDVLRESKFDINEIEDFKEISSDENYKTRFTFTYMNHDFSMETIDGKKVFAIYIENRTFNPEPIYLENNIEHDVRLYMIDNDTETTIRLRAFEEIRELFPDANLYRDAFQFTYGRRDIYYQIKGQYLNGDIKSFIAEFKYNTDTKDYDVVWLNINDVNYIGEGTQAKEIPFVKPREL